MIPTIPILTEEITETTFASRTYRIAFGTTERISGYTDELEAVKQAIYLILNTERYQYIIYSWDYGVELFDLLGKPMPYVISEIPRRIKDALTQDNRIEDVVDFTFEKKRNKLYTTFTVVTIYGDISTNLEVIV